MKKSSLHAAFTLIELLVVIAIIAALAGVAMPVYTSVIRNGHQTAAMQSARQIAMALRIYANDYNGVFPSKKNSYDEDIVTSNDALRGLVPTYLDNEKVFTVTGSKTGASADNQTDTTAKILAKGENHWAYIAGLSPTSNSNWPLLVDHTDGAGTYSTKETELGGTWVGTKAVMVMTDGSASIKPMLPIGEKRYIPRFDDRTKNALSINDYMGTDAKLLEPAQ